jgi:ribulose-phosphate 3-epimerase
MPEVQLVPSILSADFLRLGDQVRAAEAAGARRVQIDIMDGHFVPNLTMGPAIVEAVRGCTNMTIEAHLMIDNPQDYIDTFAKAGADVIIVHYEVSAHIHRLLKAIKDAGKQTGVAITPSTPVFMLQDILPFCDLLLVMTINPGFGGQDFIPETLPKIAAARRMLNERGLNSHVEVDGGIHEATIPQAVRAGANLLVAGSAVYNNKETVAQTIQKLNASIPSTK